MKRWLLPLLMLVGLLASASAVSAVQQPDVVVLVIDASGSMSGGRLGSALDAASDYVHHVRPGIAVGLVTFADTARVVVKPTTDHESAETALESITAHGDTALYDGILLAMNLVGNAAGRIVVVSDGADTKSAHSIDQVRTSLVGSAIVLDVVAIHPTGQHRRSLDELVAGTDGTVISANRVDTLYAAVSKALAPTLVEPTTAVIPVVAPPAMQQPSPVLQYGLAGAAAVLLLVVAQRAVSVLVRADQRRKRQQMLSTYARPMHDIDEEAAHDISAAERLRAVLTARFPKEIARLEAAGIELTPEKWVGLLAGIALLLTVLFMGLSTVAPAAFIIGCLFTVLGSRAVLNSRRTARITQFQEELPEMLSLIASSLRSGMTFAQAVDTAAVEADSEVSRQFRRARLEVQVGTNLESALMHVAERMESDDLRWAVTGLSIQREVGGSLSKILDTAAATIRSRSELRREIRTLSAEGRLSAYVLAGLPVVLFLFLLVSRPDYVAVFWSEPIGIVMLIAMIASFSVGWLWVNRVVKVRV